MRALDDLRIDMLRRHAGVNEDYIRLARRFREHKHCESCGAVWEGCDEHKVCEKCRKRSQLIRPDTCKERYKMASLRLDDFARSVMYVQLAVEKLHKKLRKIKR